MDIQSFLREKRPGKIVCLGMNYPPYEKHDGWLPPPFPVLFHKPSNSLVGTGDSIVIPALSERVLYEGELAVVIGKEAKNIEVTESLDYVLGFSVANDVGAADIESRSSQWASGKMFDTFCPIGPRIVPADEVGDIANLNIVTRLNGKVVQADNTRSMIFDVRAIVSYISKLTRLEPLDLILTGSPKRTGHGPDPRYPLEPGDVVEITIENIGTLSNPVIAEVHEDE